MLIQRSDFYDQPWREQLPDDVPAVYVALAYQLIEEAPAEAGGDIWQLTKWRPLSGSLPKYHVICQRDRGEKS